MYPCSDAFAFPGQRYSNTHLKLEYRGACLLMEMRFLNVSCTIRDIGFAELRFFFQSDDAAAFQSVGYIAKAIMFYPRTFRQSWHASPVVKYRGP